MTTTTSKLDATVSHIRASGTGAIAVSNQVKAIRWNRGTSHEIFFLVTSTRSRKVLE